MHLSKQNFKKLKTSDLGGLDLEQLIIPNIMNGIWQMKQLRYLLLNSQEIARPPTCFGGDISLPNLQKIESFAIGGDIQPTCQGTTISGIMLASITFHPTFKSSHSTPLIFDN